jgi:hypothetical protein
LFVFQKDYGASEGPFVETIAACELKSESMLLTIGAEGKCLGKLRVECTGLSTDSAASRRDFLEGGEAVVAEREAAGIGEKLLAEAAARGEADTGEGAREILKPLEQGSPRGRSRHAEVHRKRSLLVYFG